MTVRYRYVNCRDVVLLDEYRIVRRTPKGVWIEVAPGYPKPSSASKLQFRLTGAEFGFGAVDG